MASALKQEQLYTVEYIESLPEGRRAELIDGVFYNMAPPSRMHQEYFEPDISIICDPDKLNDKGCKGAPDWIIEITSPSTAGNDYVLKLYKYIICKNPYFS